jgi:hypothetical protein
VLEREDPGALLGALGGDAVYDRLAHGNAANLANPLVVPVAQTLHRLCREAPRLAAVKQNRQDATRVHLSLEPLGDVGGAGDLAAHRAKRLERLLDTGFDVLVVRQVVEEERI